MSDDGLVPAVDSRAAKDPLLQDVVLIGSLLENFGGWVADCLNPEESDCGAAALAKCRDALDESRSKILDFLGQLEGRFQPEADGATNYSPGLRDYLVWHLGKAMRLIIVETPATDDGWSELSKQFMEVADKITLAGTDPTGLHLVPRLAGYGRHLRDQPWAELDKRTAEQEQREFEWPEPTPYLYQRNNQPIHQSDETHDKVVEFKELIADLKAGTIRKVDKSETPPDDPDTSQGGDKGVTSKGVFVIPDDIPDEHRSCLHPNSLIAELHSGEKQTNPSQYVNRAVKKKSLRASGGEGDRSRYVDVTLGFSEAAIKILKRSPRSLGESSAFN